MKDPTGPESAANARSAAPDTDGYSTEETARGHVTDSQIVAALERELRRARAEKRFVDADEVALQLEALAAARMKDSA